MLSFRPFLHALRQRSPFPLPGLEGQAIDRWELSPAHLQHVPPALFLPGQLDRIRGTAFSSAADVADAFRGQHDSIQQATWGYRLRGVDLVDGALYAPGATTRLRRRSRLPLTYRRAASMSCGAIYESWPGNRWFGSWLIEDCLSYRLAEVAGPPVTTAPAPAAGSHAAQYEARLGMRPRRVTEQHFDELFLFSDLPNNLGKKARAEAMRLRLLDGTAPDPVPGVFLLRGMAGDKRFLANEAEIAERLATGYGFVILDPLKVGLEEIIRTCGAARIVAGVEGSQLTHGLVVMPPDATLLVLQPPERVVATLKMMTDRQGQRYAFVIGTGGAEEFSIAWEELRRTIDLVQEA